MAKNKGGRRGKYHEWLTEEGLTKLEGWARDGLTNEQIAHNIGINPDTLYTWMNKYSEIADALKKGKEVVDIQVENALLKRALGYEFEETKVIVETDGKKRVERVKKHVPPDTTAQIFWLRNRTSKWQNKDKAEIDKIIAETELIQEKTKLVKGVEKDTSIIEELITVFKGEVNDEG